MADETVLLTIKIEGTENEAKINGITTAITNLQAENKKLAETNKELAKSQGDNSEQIAKNTSQIEANKQVIAQGTATRKGLIQTIIAEDNSIKALSIRNADLVRQRNLLNTSTEEGRKKIQTLNSQIDANNKVIKDNSDALGKQKINIGNYASALDSVVPGLGGFINGLQGATKAALAFIATPIGAILAGVVAALATLKAAISTNDATADEFGKRWEQISAVFDVVLRRVGLLGDALVSLVKGDFSAAADKAAAAFSGVNDELAKAIVLSGELADRQNDLDDAQNKFNATEQARKNNIDKLIIQSKDLSKSEAERLKLSTQAEALLNQLTTDRIALSIKQSDIDIEAIGLKHDAQRGLNETTQEYGLRLLENSAIGGEEAEKIAAAIRKVDEAEAESLRTLEKLQSQQNKLGTDKQERILEDSEFTKEVRLREAEDDLSIQEFHQEKSLELTTSFEEAALDTKKALRDKTSEDDKKRQEDGIKQEKIIAQKKLMIASDVVSGLGSLFKQGSTAAKAAAIADIAINTALGFIQGLDIAQKSAKATGPLAAFAFPLFYASQVAAVLAAANQAKRAMSFAAGGGDFLTKGPTMLMVGDNPGGVERVTVTPISGKGQTVVGDGLIKMAGGGTLTTGVVASEIREASRLAVQSNQLSSIQTILVLQDFEAASMAKNQPIAQAQVL